MVLREFFSYSDQLLAQVDESELSEFFELQALSEASIMSTCNVYDPLTGAYTQFMVMLCTSCFCKLLFEFTLQKCK